MNINESGAFYMENKTEIEFTRNRRCAQVFTESAAEYVLPDYNGDVRKILYTNAEVRPSGKFAGGDEVEYSGIVVYEMIYLDSENALTSVTFTSDYEYTVKCTGEKYRDSFAETTVSNYALRLIGPRKISAKASIVGEVRMIEAEQLGIDGDTFEGEESPEINVCPYRIRKSISSENLEREYAESVAKLDGAIADEVSVISASADAIVDEVILGDGEATIRGSLNLSAIIRNGDAPAYQREKVIGFEENVAFADVAEDMRFVPEIVVSSIVSTINAQEFGTEVVVSAVLDLSVIGETNESGELISDSYLKSCAVENKYEDFSYSELLTVAHSRESESGSVQRSEVDVQNIREILFLKGIPKIESETCADGKLEVSGEIKYNGIASVTEEDGTIGYVPLKFSLPFVRTLEIGGCDSLIHEVKTIAHNASATFDAAKLYVNCSVEVIATVCEEKHLKRLACSKQLLDQPYEKNNSRIIIYYPDREESLFSVAKKYRTTVAKIAADNSLTAEVLSHNGENDQMLNGKKLIIY